MRKMMMVTSALRTVFVRAFDPGKAGWKVDADGKLAVDSSGNPVYLKEDGGEQSVDGGTIGRLNGEAKGHRERAEAAETKLKVFEGVDPAKAKLAIETVAKLDTKKLLDAGEVDRVKAEIAAQYSAQLDEATKTNGTLRSQLDDMTLQTAFGRSDFINERVAVPREMFQATFQKNFKIEDGKLIPYDASGNKIYSTARMGEIATVDEALQIIVNNYPHKDAILKAPGSGGSGNGGGGGNRGGGRMIKRGDFEALPPVQQAVVAAQMQKGEVQVVD